MGITPVTRMPRAFAAAFCSLLFFCGPAAAQPHPPEIVIGQSAALSGPQGEFGKDFRQGALAWFDVVNKAGGIEGRMLRLVTLDDGGDTKRTRANTAALIERDNALALFGYTGRAPAVAGAGLATAAKVPFIAPFSGGTQLYERNRYVFTIRASYADEVDKQVEQLVTTGISRFAVMYVSDDVKKTNLALAEQALARRGLKPVSILVVDPQNSNLPQLVQELKASQAQALLAIVRYFDVTVRQIRRSGNPLQVFGISYVANSAMPKALGEEGRGAVVSQVVPLPSKRVLTVTRDYQRDLLALDANTGFSFTSLEGYIAAKTLTAGLRKAGRGVTRESLVDAMESLGDMDFGGYAVRFTPQNHNGARFVDLTILRGDGTYAN
ncbi:MAG TPA: ABC transporter substrate-binding protein [Burkholderiales bacterium]